MPIAPGRIHAIGGCAPPKPYPTPGGKPGFFTPENIP